MQLSYGIASDTSKLIEMSRFDYADEVNFLS